MSIRLNNPYYNTSSIEDPALFFNRTEDIEAILNSLFSDVPQCISIVGQRKIGKSSLVRHITRPSTIRSFHFEPDNVIFIYFDCQKHAHALLSTENLYQELLNRLRDGLPIHKVGKRGFTSHKKSSFASQEVEQILQALDSQDLAVVIVFDEFEKAVFQSALITDGFFGSLRGYTQANRNLGWITCTSRPLHHLFEEAFDEFGVSKTRRKSESDFYNIAPPRTIRLFELPAVEQLVNEPSRTHGVIFSEADKNAILELAGNFPYFIQRVCYHLFNNHLQPQIDYEATKDRVVEEFTPLWENYWKHLDDAQKRTLSDVVNATEQGFPKAEVELLRDASLIYEDKNGNLVAFSEAFGSFVQAMSRNTILSSSEIRGVVEEVQSLRKQVNEEKQNASKAHDDVAEERRKGLTREDAISDLKAALNRRSLQMRVLLSVAFSIIGLIGLFIVPQINEWRWLLEHPKKRGMYICASIVILGLSWMIVDRKRRPIIFVSVVIAAILVLVQIS